MGHMGMRGTTLLAFLTFGAAGALTVCVASGDAAAAEKNKCGCYRNEGSGACYCDKKAKCGCPGECEPKGCEEQREKELQKEIDAETKRAAENERRKKPEKSDGAKPEKTEEDRAVPAAAAQEEAPAKPAPAGKKLNPTQMKQLAKLLDQYLGEHPDARGKTTEELRNELSLVPR
jgi:hypothetical protein